MRTFALFIMISVTMVSVAHAQTHAPSEVPVEEGIASTIIVTAPRRIPLIPYENEWSRSEGPTRIVDTSGSYPVVTYSRPLFTVGNMAFSADVRAIDPYDIDRASAPERTNQVPNLGIRIRF